MAVQIVSGNSGWERLKDMWVAGGKTSNLIDGTHLYLVYTPNGDDSPIFVETPDIDLYTSISGTISPPR
jgi:hypothetical protein